MIYYSDWINILGIDFIIPYVCFKEREPFNCVSVIFRLASIFQHVKKDSSITNIFGSKIYEKPMSTQKWNMKPVMKFPNNLNL